MEFSAFLQRVSTDLIKIPVQNEPSSNSSRRQSSASLANSHSIQSNLSSESNFALEMPIPSPSALVNQDLPECLYGLQERVIAAESALYLANEFRNLKDVILSYLNDQQMLNDYESEINALKCLRRCVYLRVAKLSIKSDVILQLMSKVQWDIKEVKSQHSQYVEVILRVRIT